VSRLATTILLFGFLLFILFWRLDEPSGPLSRTRMLMGTVVEIRVDDPEPERFRDAVTAAFDEMARIERLMSLHLAKSEVSRISRAGEPVEVSAETATVLRTALKVSVASDGAFNPGLGRLIRLWGFTDGEPRVPSKMEIEEALVGIGPESLTLEDGKLFKSDRSITIDLGGVAKGYAIDRAVEMLSAAGVKHASVNAGGDLRLLGDRDGTPWRIGIQHPRKKDAVLATLSVADRAVVTSGDYERFFEQAGRRYHHILDPYTGYPAERCQEVTVVADSAALADALATAAFVLGPEKGLELLQKTEKVEGLIVAADGQVVFTSGLQEIVQWP